MSILPIRTLGDPVLRQQGATVDRFDDWLARLADDMFEAMYDAPGVGLAAQQVGIALRLFVYDAGEGTQPGVVANPVLTDLHGEQDGDEGCLSVPGLFYPTTRARSVRLQGQDLRGDPLTLEVEDLVARIFQHETDHTNAILYLDHLSEVDRRRAMAEMRDRELSAPDPGTGAASGSGRFRRSLRRG